MYYSEVVYGVSIIADSTIEIGNSYTSIQGVITGTAKQGVIARTTNQAIATINWLYL
nr:hypothetical protein [Nostoc sp. NMS8]